MSIIPSIFVSHGSKDNELTEHICQRLRPASDGTSWGYDVLVDFTELKPGVDWPLQLHEYMAKCSAAVLLLTNDAVTSPWVLKEATILSWRHALDKNFKVFTVRFPEVTEELLQVNKFNPLSLDLIQQITSTDPDVISQKIRDVIGQPVHADTPFDKVIKDLSDLLMSVGNNKLQLIAEKLRVAPPQWRPEKDLRSQFVEEIARQVVCGMLGHYEGFHQLINDLSFTTPCETIKQIYRIISPYWVAPEAAGRLPRLCAIKRRCAAAMNGARVNDFTARMYLRRAFPLSNLYDLILTAGGNAENWANHFKKEICEHIRRDRGTSQSDEQIIAELKDETPGLFVVLPPPLPDSESLQQLMSLFPSVTFILWTGSELERNEQLLDVEWLEPPVDLKKEAFELNSRKKVDLIIRNMNQI